MDKNQYIPLMPKGAGRFPVSVLMGYQKIENNAWISGRWEVNGLVVGDFSQMDTSNNTRDKLSKQVTKADADSPQCLWSGLMVELYKDDAESYYHNLMSDNPRAFIICKTDEENTNEPQPFLVTLSYDEAASYMEVDEMVFSVDMPAELYRWLEQFVLENYVPEKKKKRRRENWKETSLNEKP